MLRPALRAVEDAENFRHVLADPVNGKKRIPGEHQLARPWFTPRSPTKRKLLQGAHAVIETQRNAAGRLRAIVFLGVVADVGEVADSRVCSANPHLAGKPCVDELADVLVV